VLGAGGQPQPQRPERRSRNDRPARCPPARSPHARQQVARGPGCSGERPQSPPRAPPRGWRRLNEPYGLSASHAAYCANQVAFGCPPPHSHSSLPHTPT
jgi:hypothetical protein